MSNSDSRHRSRTSLIALHGFWIARSPPHSTVAFVSASPQFLYWHAQFTIMANFGLVEDPSPRPKALLSSLATGAILSQTTFLSIEQPAGKEIKSAHNNVKV